MELLNKFKETIFRIPSQDKGQPILISAKLNEEANLLWSPLLDYTGCRKLSHLGYYNCSSNINQMFYLI